MSYRTQVDDGMGGVEYITVETPDEDYDRMMQEELDGELPTKEYPFTTLDTEKDFNWRDYMWMGIISIGSLALSVPWVVGAWTIGRWMFTK
jgi:hypothetical protein